MVTAASFLEDKIISLSDDPKIGTILQSDFLDGIQLIRQNADNLVSIMTDFKSILPAVDERSVPISIDDILGAVQQYFDNKSNVSIEISESVDASDAFYSNPEMIYQLIILLINNSLKTGSASEHKKIYLEASGNQKEMTLMYSDNATLFSQENMETLKNRLDFQELQGLHLFLAENVVRSLLHGKIQTERLGQFLKLRVTIPNIRK